MPAMRQLKSTLVLCIQHNAFHGLKYLLQFSVQVDDFPLYPLLVLFTEFLKFHFFSLLFLVNTFSVATYLEENYLYSSSVNNHFLGIPRLFNGQELCAFTSMGSIPAQGANIPQSIWHDHHHQRQKSIFVCVALLTFTYFYCFTTCTVQQLFVIYATFEILLEKETFAA